MSDSRQQEMAEALRIGQNSLLEMIAKDVPLEATLDSLLRLIENQSDGVLCSVLLLDESGEHLLHGAAPSLPKAYCDLVHGVAIGPRAGSCGTAAHRQAQVIVTDIMNDPLWADYAALAQPFGLRACWSTPIVSYRGKTLGTFAMYYRETRHPGDIEKGLIGVATHIAGIAIERCNKDRELLRYQQNLEGLVSERTAELMASKERTEAANLALSLANKDLASALSTLSVAQEELVRREKMAALGALVAGVSHELNTPLGNGLLVASTLQEEAQRTLAELNPNGLTHAAVERYLTNTVAGVDILMRNLSKAADLIRRFKQVAVDQSGDVRRQFNLNEVLQDLCLMMEPMYRKTPYRLVLDLGEDAHLDSHPGALGQVLTNLISNSLLHGFEGRSSGEMRISTRTIDEKTVAITFQDNGVGIAEENLGRVFDPFFTTKFGQGGSGLGMHIVYNLATGVLGGKLQISSKRGAGMCIMLSIPHIAPLAAGEAESGVARGNASLPASAFPAPSGLM